MNWCHLRVIGSSTHATAVVVMAGARCAIQMEIICPEPVKTYYDLIVNMTDPP